MLVTTQFQILLQICVYSTILSLVTLLENSSSQTSVILDMLINAKHSGMVMMMEYIHTLCKQQVNGLLSHDSLKAYLYMTIIKRKLHTWHEEIETYVYGTSVLTVHAIAID